LFTEEEVEECSSCTSNVVDRGNDALEFGLWVIEVLSKLIVGFKRPLITPWSYPKSKKP